MKPDLKLSPLILERFSSSNEPFAIIDSRLYTLDNVVDKKNNWNYLGKDYGLFESEKMRKFRNDVLFKDQDKIERYMSWVIDFKLLRRLNRTKRSADNVLNYYSDLRRDSITNFFEKVFDRYYRGRRSIENSIEDFDLETNISDEVTYPRLDNIKNLDSFIDEVIPSSGMFAFKGNCYALVDYSCNKTENGIVKLGQKRYSLENDGTLEDMISRYKSVLRGKIESAAIEHGKKYKDQINRLLSERQKITRNIASSNNENDSMEFHDLGFKKDGNNRYLIYLEIKPYFIKKDGNFYVFNDDRDNSKGSKKTVVGTDVHIDSGRLSIDSPPVVLNMPLSHPFVYSDGEICFNGSQRWLDNDIRFNHSYDLDDASLPGKLAFMLREAEKNITKGYIGQTLKPVHNISGYKPIAHDETEVKNYAGHHGIPEDRIFVN